MLASSLYPLVFFPFTLFIFSKWCWRRRRTNKLPIPPSDLVIGHVRFIPRNGSWIVFSAWRKKFGDIFQVNLLGNPVVVINSLPVARQLLDLKGSNFSDRPPLLFYNEWLGWKYSLPFMRYGDRFHLHRRLIRPYMTPSAVTTYHQTMVSQLQRCLQYLKQSPSDFREHIVFFVAGTILKITYGHHVKDSKDPELKRLKNMANESSRFDFSVVVLLDWFPFLQHLPEWLPGMFLKRRALYLNAQRQKISEDMFNFSIRAKLSGEDDTTLVSKMLDEYMKRKQLEPSLDIANNLDPEMKNDLMGLAIVMYSAGVETTASSLERFILAMAMHQDVVLRAQAEIDSITGGPGGRLPTFEDRDKLPYVDCILKEVHRWNPTVPLGVARATINQDSYNGMEIPARTTVLYNIWLMCNDEANYSSPEVFDPSRFLRHEKGDDIGGVNTIDPNSIVFGFGRRVCVGLHHADAIMWLFMANVLAMFDILPPIDPITGKEMQLSAGFDTGITSHPLPFSCRILPRSHR